jgi:hypothetical protein
VRLLRREGESLRSARAALSFVSFLCASKEKKGVRLMEDM